MSITSIEITDYVRPAITVLFALLVFAVKDSHLPVLAVPSVFVLIMLIDARFGLFDFESE